MERDIDDNWERSSDEEGGEGSWELTRQAEIDPTLVVIDVLGGGWRYEVYRAWDRTLQCQVAVKVLRPNEVERDSAMAYFEREIALTSRLSHPNLVRLLRWQSTPPRPFMVFELINARTVGDHLSDVGPVSIPEMCLLGIRMLSALHYMHAQSVLHLDVKPHNVTMGDPPRLLDLGLARTFSGRLEVQSAIGTDPYISPEVCLHEFATPQSDLFSLGVTLYEAVSGTQPFSDGDHSSSDRKERFPQLVEDPQPLREVADVPQKLEAIVMSCLSRDPGRRPREAVDVAVALQTILEGLGLQELYAWPKGFRIRMKEDKH